MAEKRKAYTAAIIYAFVIGLSFMFVKMTLAVASSMDSLAHRFTIAMIGVSILVVLKREKMKIDKYDLLKILPLALLYPIAFFTFQVFGLARISSSEAGVIHATVPIFTVVFASTLLKEKATRRQLIFISLSVIGVIYMLFMNGESTNTANIIGSGFILLSALATSLYNVFARKLIQQYTLVTLTYVMTLCGFLVFNAIAVGNHVVNGTINQFFLPFMHIDFVLAILYLGILSSLGTSYLSNYALSKIEASKMSVFSNFATLITIVAGVIFLQETFHLYHLIGAIVIIIGVVGTNYFGNERKSNEKI
ncbi:DMT family transporter [Lysinibacillus parviboronicapiens]|uniref:DMT family transporter n=1 Tax=Lysinibacillus parviboronicapiens TaxID=436516 RepID=UPI000D367843|nr:DMT family transporter [Lysinibacillus parviboronicapiens]